MSELKEWTASEIEEYDDARLELAEDGKIDCTRVYIKADVDKVIADLEESHKMEVEQLLMEIAELKKERNWLAKDRSQAYDDLEKRAQLNIKQEESNRHQKFKRCLAMAMWCRLKRLDAADYRIPREKWKFYDKWNKRWLKIAEKFKEAK